MMRRFILNKWFILSALLIIGLAAFSFATYQSTRSICSFGKSQGNKQAVSSQKGELIWDAVSSQFSSISVH